MIKTEAELQRQARREIEAEFKEGLVPEKIARLNQERNVVSARPTIGPKTSTVGIKGGKPSKISFDPVLDSLEARQK